MNIYKDASGNTLPVGAAFELGGLSYPSNWLANASADDLAAHQITLTVEVDPSPVPQIPQQVSPRQARLALNAAGLLTQVTNAIAAADQATQITWEFASIINRDDPLIAQIGAALNLTSAQIDALFEQAAAY